MAWLSSMLDLSLLGTRALPVACVVVHQRPALGAADYFRAWKAHDGVALA